MKKSIMRLLFIAVSMAAPALFAETLKIPADAPVAAITFPEGWTASVNGDTIAAGSDDGTAIINVIMTRPDMLGPSNDKAWTLLKFKPDFDSFKESKTTVNGMNAVAVNVEGKDSSGGPMKVSLTSVEVTKDKGVMVIASGDGKEKHADEITAVINSIVAAK
jgi:hypothetical protein